MQRRRMPIRRTVSLVERYSVSDERDRRQMRRTTPLVPALSMSMRADQSESVERSWTLPRVAQKSAGAGAARCRLALPGPGRPLPELERCAESRVEAPAGSRPSYFHRDSHCRVSAWSIGLSCTCEAFCSSPSMPPRPTTSRRCRPASRISSGRPVMFITQYGAYNSISHVEPGLSTEMGAPRQPTEPAELCPSRPAAGALDACCAVSPAARRCTRTKMCSRRVEPSAASSVTFCPRAAKRSRSSLLSVGPSTGPRQLPANSTPLARSFTTIFTAPADTSKSYMSWPWPTSSRRKPSAVTASCTTERRLSEPPERQCRPASSDKLPLPWPVPPRPPRGEAVTEMPPLPSGETASCSVAFQSMGCLVTRRMVSRRPLLRCAAASGAAACRSETSIL